MLLKSGSSLLRMGSGLVADVPSDQTLTLYNQQFDTDRTVDFAVAPASLAHDPAATVSGAANGAMVHGAPGESFPNTRIRFSTAAGKRHEIYIIARVSGSGTETGRVYVRYLDASLATLYTYTISVIALSPSHTAEQINPPVAPANTAWLDVACELRGGPIAGGSTRRFELHRLDVYDITNSAATPVFANVFPHWWSDELFVGNNSQYDFSGSFSGVATGYALLDGNGSPVTQPHSFSGGVLSVTPDTEIAATTWRVYAKNGSRQSVLSAPLKLSVSADPLQLSAGTPPDDIIIETSRPMPPVAFDRYHTGGLPPYSYELISGPSWAVIEGHGLVWGRATASPEAVQNLTVRVTDARNDTVDLTTQITVLATLSRTPTRTLANGEALFTVLRNNVSAGGVLLVPSGITFTMGNGFQAKQLTDSQTPIIIRGDGSTVLPSFIFDECSGLIFENFNVTPSSLPATKNTPIIDCRSSDRVFFQDMTVDGWTESLSNPQPTAPWLNASLQAYHGNGIQLGGNHLVVDNVVFTRCYEAITGSGAYGFYDCETADQRDDGATIYQSRGALHSGVTTGAHGGNYQSTDHRDNLQGFGDDAPVPQNVTIDNGWYSCGGVDDVQGLHFDQDAWGSRGEALNETYRGFVIRNTVILASTDNIGLLLERVHDGLISNCLIIAHPDLYASHQANIQLRRPCKLTIRNSIFYDLVGDGYTGNPVTHGDWTHLVTLTNNVELSAPGAPAITDIFPNFFNGGLGDEARLAMSTSWHAANPNIGPPRLWS